MKLLTLLTTLALSTSLTLAVPLTSDEEPTPTTTSTTTSSSSLALASSSAPATPEDNTCPPSHRSKQCCTSIDGLADSFFGQVGQVIPILKDVKLSSIAAFDCKGMSDTDSHDECRTSVMCCNGDPNKMDKNAYKMQCKPYDEAMEDKAKAEKISKERPLAAALAKASSRSVYMMSMSSWPTSSASVAAAAEAEPTPTPAEG